MQSTIYIEPKDEDADIDEARSASRRFSASLAMRALACVKRTWTPLQKWRPEYLNDTLAGFKTFKVESKRADKKFPLGSMEISREVGAALLRANPHISVDVHNPEITVARGNPRESRRISTARRSLARAAFRWARAARRLFLSAGGLDSPVAAWMMAKRGVELTAIHFASPPYTSERAHEKVVRC